jgi:hypothetical protein
MLTSAKIEEVIIYDEQPLYKVRILKYYDTLDRIKENVMLNSFRKKPNKFLKTIISDFSVFETTENFEKYIIEHPENFTFYVDKFNIFITRRDMNIAYEKITEFLIVKKIYELELLSTNTQYTGKFRVNTKKEFEIKLLSLFEKISPEEMSRMVRLYKGRFSYYGTKMTIAKNKNYIQNIT